VGVTYGGSSALVTPRDDIGLGFDEIDLEANRGGYVGFQIAPLIEASVALGQFRKMKLGQLMQPRKTERNPDGSYKRIDGDFDKDSFQVDYHGLEARVDHVDAAVYASMIDAYSTAAEITRHGVIEAHELRVIAACVALSGTAATNEFDDDVAAITKDFTAYKQTFRAQCGYAPNALCLDAQMVDALCENASVQDKFVGASDRTARALRLQGLAAALGLDEIIEANGMKNTVSAPKAFSLTSTWPADKALLFRKSTAASMIVPQFMRTIHWSGAGSRPGCGFEEYEEPQTGSTIIRQILHVQEKVIHSAGAMLLTGIKTA
jgi:hypothetical protein